MRKFLAIVLCIIMLITVFMPAIGYAAGDKGLEDAIKVAKSQFKIPDSYKFNFDVYSQNSRKIWSLSWTSNGSEGVSIYIRVDENGKILNYDNNRPIYNVKKKLPKISISEAKKIATDFVKKMNPKDYNQLKLVDNMQNSSLDYGYSFGFVRTVNKLPYYANNVYVMINKDTGEIQSYSNDWANDVVFPDASKVISNADAQKEYKDKLGLELIYKYSYQNEKIRVYPIYTTKVNNDSFAINALSGDKIQTGYTYSMYDQVGGMGGFNRSMKSAEAAADVKLTPEETKAIDDVSSLLTQEAAEKIVRSMKYLNISDDYKLESANLSKIWPLRTEFLWQIGFTKKSTEKTMENQYLSVNINAKSGELLNFYKNSPRYGDKETAVYDEAQAKAVVEKFLNEIQPEKFKQTEAVVESRNIKNPGATLPIQYNFNYIRKVNGAKFPDNNFYVNIDAISGEIINYNSSWFNVDFPDISKVISLEAAYGNIFSKVGLELQYKPKYIDESEARAILPTKDKIIEVVPVYAFRRDKPLFIDAINRRSSSDLFSSLTSSILHRLYYSYYIYFHFIGCSFGIILRNQLIL